MSIGRTFVVMVVVALAASVLGCSSPPRLQAAGPEVPSVGFVGPAGARLRVRSVGPTTARTTLIVVHGGPGLSLESLAGLDALAGPDRRVVGYDQRGAGQSDRPADGDYGIDAQLRDLDLVRAWTDSDRIDLLGKSWGGLLAAAYTAAHPDIVRSLVLLDAAPLDWAAFLEGQRRFASREQALRAQGIVAAALPPDVGDSCLPALMARIPVYLAHPTDPVPDLATTCRASTSRETFADFQTPSAQAELARLSVALGDYRGRALAIMGERDPFGLGWIDRSTELLAGATVERLVVPDAGHLSSLEQPGIVVPAIRSWLDAGL